LKRGGKGRESIASIRMALKRGMERKPLFLIIWGKGEGGNESLGKKKVSIVTQKEEGGGRCGPT